MIDGIFIQMLSNLPEDILNDIYEYNTTHRKAMASVMKELVEVAAQVECESCRYIHYQKESIYWHGYYYCCDDCVMIDEYCYSHRCFV